MPTISGELGWPKTKALHSVKKIEYSIKFDLYLKIKNLGIQEIQEHFST